MKNKKFKKIICVLLAVVMILTPLIVCPFTALAVDSPTTIESYGLSFWADPENTLTQQDIDDFTAGTKTTMVGAVGVYKRSSSSSNYYLFLPSSADCENLKLWFTGTTASIGDTTLTSGEVTNVFADIKDGGVSQVYTLTIDSKSYTLTAIKSGDVGTVYVDTESGSMSSVNGSSDHSVYEAGTIMVIDADGNVNYDGALEKIQGRGNGTWSDASTYKKYPYNIKLGTSTSLLGMGKAKKWCLLANNNDTTLIKNQLTYDFADYIGIKYQPHCKPVDVYVNQQYYGSYQLAEKVEIKSNRLNISDAYENLEIANGTVDETGTVTPADLTGTTVGSYTVNSSTNDDTTTIGTSSTFGQITGNKRYSSSLNDPDDYTGGYLYEIEISNRWVEENAGFCAYNRQGWVIKSCDYASKSMVTYSYNLLYALGSAVYNSGTVPSTSTKQTNGATAITIGSTTRVTNVTGSSTNPAPSTEYQGKKWSDILDADSAVKYYWTQEYFKNMDSSTSSTYFYKESDSTDSKLYAGPMWDMDNSIGYNLDGSRWGYSWTSSTGWYTKNARIYRYIANQSYTGFTTDTQSPLNFYAALATNCSDFWTQASSYWYSLIEPATQILLGNSTDPTGTLHSTQYYVNTIAKSNTMDNLRLNLNSDAAWDYDEMYKGINDWFTARNKWISDTLSTTDISNATVEAIPNQTCTGAEITPSLTVTYNGVTLVEGTDYTVEYSNNIAASGKATATITGKGYYNGTKTVTFTINAGSLKSATIDEKAYAGDTLNAVAKNSSGDEITQFVKYQWAVDGVDVSGATDSSYTIAEDDKGKQITVTVTGDGSNISSTGVKSNACTVSTDDRPKGYTKTIAAWDYDYTANADGLTTADETGTTYYYTATSGENAATAQLTGSVDAKTTSKIKWSGTSDLYTNDSNTVTSDQSPVIGTSKNDGVAWGEYPYFETVVSTTGYEDIQFSAKLGGTKKAPGTWQVQYSTDGTTFTSVEGATYTITANKSMEQAFNSISLPAECNNKSKLYIRIVAYSNLSIAGAAFVGVTGGDASVNNIAITGTSTAVIDSLEAPTIATTSTLADASTIFDTDTVAITDQNGGAPVYYSINDGEVKAYESAINPFDSTSAKIGDTATITAYAQYGSIVSNTTTYTVTYGGVNISTFNYDDYSTNVSNGAVFSTGGVYDESAKMTAYTDGNSQYVPLWNSTNKAYSIAPDDGALWSASSGFYFEISTVGYTNVAISAKAYTTAQGPNSVSLQYSTDGSSWVTVSENIQLNANGSLEQALQTVSLPAACANQTKVYIRLATTENSIHGSDTVSQTSLHNNASKGNLYINDIVISGNDNGEIKMPYTNKTTNYFGTGTIKYYCPSGDTMSYAVVDPNGKIIMSGDYPEEGINISSYSSFNSKDTGAYTVSVYAGDDDDRVVNTRKYYYKGETITKFNYNDSKRLLASYLNSDSTQATNTSGVNAGTLAMYPNSETATTLSYTNTYGVKVSATADNLFAATKKLDKASGNGYWLVTTSTTGYTALTLNLEQLSSNKGPRDWGLAYSTDGVNYTYITDSNVRAISNDSTTTTVETYNNFALPSECDDQETLYIKIFINGGEAVNGKELETLDSGNTGINAIELSGVEIAKGVTFYTVALDSPTATTGSNCVEATITIDGNDYTTTNGELNIDTLTNGEEYTATISANKNNTFAREITFTAADGLNRQVQLVCLDMNGDKVINGKDYALISKSSDVNKTAYESIFQNFANIKESNFNYTN